MGAAPAAAPAVELQWERRRLPEPQIDIDFWTLLWEARIVEGAWRDPRLVTAPARQVIAPARPDTRRASCPPGA